MFESVTNHQRYLISHIVMISLNFIETMYLFTILQNLYDIMFRNFNILANFLTYGIEVIPCK